MTSWGACPDPNHASATLVDTSLTDRVKSGKIVELEHYLPGAGQVPILYME